MKDLLCKTNVLTNKNTQVITKTYNTNTAIRRQQCALSTASIPLAVANTSLSVRVRLRRFSGDLRV